MIMPRMATLLSFIITDLSINPDLLDDVFIEAVNNSFNRITIDGETSTNDMVIMMANGRAANSFFPKESSDYQTFKSSLNALFLDLSKLILKDAEGATKTICILVEEAKSNEEAKKIAYQIANSNLVKTAFFGEDPNWGRILSAIGTVDAEIIPERIDIFFDDVIVVENSICTGMELQAKQILMKKEFRVTINLHIGQGTAEVGTTDLTTEYIKINASYSS
jgi:glutamate N-acetyltransferase/amino-acid N-acetyltransferase